MGPRSGMNAEVRFCRVNTVTSFTLLKEEFQEKTDNYYFYLAIS
jgi:hypothetical protein